MAAVLSSFDLPSCTSRKSAAWSCLLLEYLEEFATLVWYLVADGKLVEEIFSRTMTQLDTTPFDASGPLIAYNQAREILITQTLELLAATRKEDEENWSLQPGSGELPDLPRLAFMLRFVIHSPEGEVAKFLDVTPSQARGLFERAIDHLSASEPLTVPIDWHNA
jgi:DNA-directed RNA polymerase specialized sigma24 family protein